ncbi:MULTISPECIES: hypothetical protein [Nocardia]|uniref:Excreted virulence factor EspC (Type VII ESX diderm) n=1 Tax=Nocardia coubleae TaxID=356147 RepID=A0A846W5E2_9NOCA|nr:MULTISPECIES: hypothetical protein [Nocardia]MCA2205697.1 hypothetical protein [Nocardia rosealba]NKX87837.1 hypothetical protein [Nocardia coubleae]
MALEVSPDSLRQAAAALALLPNDIENAKKLGAAPVAAALRGSAVGSALGGSDSRSKTAKDVLKARFNHLSGLMALSANKYEGTDADAARRLAAVADLNSGNAHEGK